GPRGRPGGASLRALSAPWPTCGRPSAQASGGGPMRRRPSVATVIATIALIVSLSCTAMATVIVTKNNQVAAHTIAGANAPPGGNKNLISGSVGTSDLHSGAVTIGKLA